MCMFNMTLESALTKKKKKKFLLGPYSQSASRFALLYLIPRLNQFMPLQWPTVCYYKLIVLHRRSFISLSLISDAVILTVQRLPRELFTTETVSWQQFDFFFSRLPFKGVLRARLHKVSNRDLKL